METVDTIQKLFVAHAGSVEEDNAPFI